MFVLGMWVPFLFDDWCIISCITWNIDIKFRNMRKIDGNHDKFRGKKLVLIYARFYAEVVD